MMIFQRATLQTLVHMYAVKAAGSVGIRLQAE